jgi:hypothetical protein
MNKEDDDMGELGPAEKIVDMGDLHGNPIPKEKPKPVKITQDELELSDEEEEMLKKKLERIRKSDPFIYR